MEQTSQHRIITKDSTGMNPPLVYHPNFDDMTNYGNNIHLGSAAEIKYPDSHKKGYQHHLASITHSLPDHDKPIPIK